MRHDLFSKICSLAAASVTACAWIPFSCMFSCTAAAVPQAEHSDPVSVVIQISGDPVMQSGVCRNADDLDSPAAEKKAESCKNAQHAVQARIRAYYPELTVGYSYSTLYNGFSCTLPRSLIAQTAALPGVVSITETPDFQLTDTDAAVQYGVPADLQGYSGAGTVIAVIDSELDVTHPMFAPLDESIEPALSYEDIAEVIDSGTLNIKVDPQRAYISSKLPYVIDYADSDPYGGVRDVSGYHGTHISGIAAGNACKTADGQSVSGIAKDAQLLFFACGRGKNMSYSATLAALEDAVRLHADVINMSWGTTAEYYGSNPFSDAIAAADRAGIIVCNSAGNLDNGTRTTGKTALPDQPDTGTICDKAERGSPLLVIGSAETGGQAEAGMFLLAGEQIIYRPTMNADGNLYYLSQELAPGDYAYADCGSGTDAEFRAANPVNQLALIQRTSGQSLSEIAQRAQHYHACGLIVSDLETPDGLDYAYSNASLKIAVVTYAEGQMLRAAADQTVTFTGENVMQEHPAAVSAFSSWGVKHSLDLRPDLMGIGGRVCSAAYNASAKTLSGTSMASAYAAGCAAVLRGMLKDDLPDGTALTAMLRTKLMNTAIPYEENELYVSPRRQGAGLVSVERAAAAKVRMTDRNGEAKINLFDQLGSDFSFDVILQNDSGADVVYPDAKLCLTTDGIRHDSRRNCDILSGQQALRCETSLMGPVTVMAGESLTLPVQVSLDPAQYAELCASFRNGFFIEGFLLLSGAAESSDISMPLLGFSGDWAQLPIGDADRIMAAVIFGEDYQAGSVPLVEYNTVLDTIRSRVPGDIPKYELLDLKEYASEDEIRLLETGKNQVWISPNGDGIADAVYGMKLIRYRDARADLTLRNAAGKTVWSEKAVPYQEVFELDLDQSALPAGEYTLTAAAYIDYPGSAAHPQEYCSSIHVDRTAPDVSAVFSRRSGRQILTITASDDQKLQGIAVTGFYKPMYQIEDPACIKEGDSWFYGGMQYRGSYPWTTGRERENADQLPLVLQELAGFSNPLEHPEINFRDYIAPEPDADGVWTIDYDVTEFEDYTITVLDEAYNFTVIDNTDDSAEVLTKAEGYWQDYQHGIWTITPAYIRFTDYFDGTVTNFGFTAKNNQLELIAADGTRNYTIKMIEENIYELTDNATGETVEIIRDQNLERWLEKPFYPINNLIQAAETESAAAVGHTPQRTELNYVSGMQSVGFSVYFEFEEDGCKVEVCDRYEALSLFTGTGTAQMKRYTMREYGPDVQLSPLRNVNLFRKPMSAVPPGLYHLKDADGTFLFSDDGESGMILYPSQFSSVLDCTEDTPFSYAIDSENRITIRWKNKEISGVLTSAGQGGAFIVEPDDAQRETNSLAARFGYFTFDLITDAPDVCAQLLSTQELTALAAAYVKASAGFEPDEDATEFYSVQSDCLCEILFNFGHQFYGIIVDPLTLQMQDDYGVKGDLRQPPQLPEGGLSRTEICEIAQKTFAEQDDITPAYIETRLNPDGTYTAVARGETHDELDVRTFDAMTGRLRMPDDAALPGDVNCDGEVSADDAQLTLNAYVLMMADHESGLTPEQEQAADVNGDNAVSVEDAQMILLYYVRNSVAGKPTNWEDLIEQRHQA